MKFFHVSTFLSAKLCSALACVVFTGHSAAAVVTINVSDDVPGGQPDGSGSGARSLSTSNGMISAANSLPTITYTLTGIDLTTVGGVSNHTIVFDVIFDSSDGDPVFNAFGNVSDTSGGNQFISDTGNLSGIFSLTSVSDGFDPSNISLQFTGLRIGSFGADDGATITTDSGSFAAPGNDFQFLASESFAIAPNSGRTINLRRFDIAITAVPETSSAIAGLLIISGLVLNRRRA